MKVESVAGMIMETRENSEKNPNFVHHKHYLAGTGMRTPYRKHGKSAR